MKASPLTPLQQLERGSKQKSEFRVRFDGMPWRKISVLLGLSLVFYLVQKTGFDVVYQALISAAIYLPIILLCEFFFWFFGVLSQRALYGDEAKKIPWKEVVRLGCSAYAIMGLIPMGRIVAESVRAVSLAKYVGKSKAAWVAVQVQIVALCVTGVLASVCAGAFAWVLGSSMVTLIAILNATGVLTLGLLALLATKHFRLGQKLSRLLPRVKVFGEEFDAYFVNSNILPKKAVFFEVLCRVSQIIQNGVLVLAVGGALGLSQALSSEGLHLIGATLGDLVPGQLGVTELVYSQAGLVLGIGMQKALSIALLAHIAQLFWVVVALVVQQQSR